MIVIGQGRFRDCISFDLKRCGKKQKKYLTRSFLGFNMQFDSTIYCRLLLGINDLNSFEYSIIKSLPHSMRNFIPENISLEDNYLKMDRSIDFDGTYSTVISSYGSVDNKRFWEHIESLNQCLISNNLWFLDIFNEGNNLLVYRKSEDEYIPIIIDFKRLGRKMYPFQLNLIFASEQKKKYLRRYQRFQNRFNPLNF